ncbi:hypothetical protein Taro_047785 [Colocasia esculenta]|uniref:Uncharacterized protein n=1 Tax=Colocasia esculenta TaxID=4460 RepID=A0A843X5T6_COLES|nr:hypothetical protein [Colocasia esculenta]
MMGKSESAGLAVSTAPGLPTSHWLPENPVSRRPPTALPCKTHAASHEWAMSKNKNIVHPVAASDAVDPRKDVLYQGINGHGLEGGVVLGEGEGGGDQERARCEWDFRLCSVISPAATREASDALGAIEFDPSDQLVATGGIARKIRIYTMGSLLESRGECGGVGGTAAALSDHAAACSYYICTPAKLSSLRWRPDSGGRVIGAGDYDGVVTEYDLERRLSVFERDEHEGRRVWSVDYSRWIPQLGASGSDDGTAHLWDSRCGRDVASLCPVGGEPRRPVCCVEFDPFGESLIGLGCADRRAYVYDLRMGSDPVTVFRGHRRTVTYLRFIGGGRVVSAGTDGCLRLWDLLDAREMRAYEGHANTRNFVGLSVWRAGGLLACGSETNEVYVYDMRWGQPIWVGGFEAAAEEGGRGFVSSVCWRQAGDDGDACTIVAGTSNGVLQVFSGRKKPAAAAAPV